MKKYIYMAGSITGLTFDGCQDWRTDVASKLDSDSVECLTPLRGKSYLKEHGKLKAEGFENPISSNKGITRRDMFDTHRATCLFVNLLGATRVSIGTCMEIAWAYRAHIPTIVVMEPGNLHQHAMVIEASTYIVPTIEEAVALARFLLNEAGA